MRTCGLKPYIVDDTADQLGTKGLTRAANAVAGWAARAIRPR